MPRIEQLLRKMEHKCQRPVYVGRPEAAAVATGYYKVHEQEQKALVERALGL